MSGWFNVDKAGLAAVLERRGKFFALAELISNAWDSGTERVRVSLSPQPGAPFALLVVEDWGEGFADLDHAHTMFARSRRAGDATKRGRFNLGEKLVLACCRWANIDTTSGYLKFEEGGNLRRSSTDRPQGTLFEAEIRMTRDEYREVCEAIANLLPPVPTTFNGTEIDCPKPMLTFTTKLPTEIADDDGQIRRTVRLATVEVYETDGPGDLLEMGIPVVETENGFRVNVLQKVPLNMDRDNVTPAFLRAVNAALLNAVADRLTGDEAAKPWAQEAAGDARATPEAVASVVKARFGERAVIATPGDPMANAAAEAAGFTVVPGGALSADAWANVRKHATILPSSQVFVTPRPEVLAARAEAQEQSNACPTCGKPW